MSTDRELLELAAKALGINLEWLGEGRMAACYDSASECEWWNPLTDDGDALRLAVKLELEVDTAGGFGLGIGQVGAVVRAGDFPPIFELHGSDPAAATRRAIVRAAAEIGRAMP